jgi:hypothetical protein
MSVNRHWGRGLNYGQMSKQNAEQEPRNVDMLKLSFISRGPDT